MRQHNRQQQQQHALQAKCKDTILEQQREVKAVRAARVYGRPKSRLRVADAL